MNDEELKKILASTLSDIYVQSEDNLEELKKTHPNHPSLQYVRPAKELSKNTKQKSNYELHLLEQSKSNLEFVASVLGSMNNAIAFRDGEVTLDDLGMVNPASRVIRLSDLKNR